MRKRYTRRWLLWLWLIAMLAFEANSGKLPLTQVQEAVAQEPGVNLLRNGDFEEGGPGQAWPFQDGIPEVQVAPGWRAFWLDDPPPYAVIPSNCIGLDPGCYWARPEFRGMTTAEFAYRVHGGQLSQKYFTFGRQHEAGLYQQVSGITPGVRLRFSAYLETWSCLAEGEWNNCPTAPYSNHPAPMHTRVGIDPTGGTDPWASTIVWSQEVDTFDQWTNFWVEATAEADTVTVFIHSRPDWVDGWPRINNDVYVDDASLVVVGEGEPTPPPVATATPTPLPPTATPLPPTATPPPPTPTASTPPATPPPPTPTPSAPTPTPSAPTPTPSAPTPTPSPAGGITYVVQRGDTLFSIARRFGVTLEQLRQLNGIGSDNLIHVGQRLIIVPGPVTVTPPPPPPPGATSTPLPDGTLVHIVQHGETLFSIARRYGVTVEQLRQLNGIGSDNLIHTGQRLVISTAPNSSTPTPTAQPTPPPSPTATAAPTPRPAVLCLVAYVDRNGDGSYQPQEDALLPGLTVRLDGPHGPVGTYITDGMSEPYCFQGLEAGDYLLTSLPPEGYLALQPETRHLTLEAGEESSCFLGYRREGAEALTPSPAPTGSGADEAPPPEATPATSSSGGRAIGGTIVIVLLAAGLFMALRRRGG